MRKTNITAGECLNETLSRIYPDEQFVPFNEAMIDGKYISDLFSKQFIKERAAFHSVSLEEYIGKMHGFLNILNHLQDYEEIDLWFGDEPFCNANRAVVIKTLKAYGYQKKLVSKIVNEITGEIISIEVITDK